MEGDKYLFESFGSEMKTFDREFTHYLNKKRGDRWEVQSCSFCHETDAARTWASCIFRQVE